MLTVFENRPHRDPASGIDQFFRGDLDITGDLPQQNRRDVAALMEGNRRATPIHVPKLLVRALLPTLLKTKCLEPRDDLHGLQHRQFAFRHVSAHLNRLRSDELRFQFRLTVLE